MKSYKRKNFGYGRKASYAGVMVLNRNYRKKPASRYAYKHRWHFFTKYLEKVEKIQDTRKVCAEVLKRYTEHLKRLIDCGEIKISYAGNLLSTVNVVLTLLRGDKSLRISPKEQLGCRKRARQTPPEGMDKKAIKAVADSISALGAPLQGMIILLIREFGLRLREGIMFDAKTALKQVQKYGKFRIIHGTKGGYGRKMQRWIEVSTPQIELLVLAAALQTNRCHLVPHPGKVKAIQFMRSVSYYWRKVRDHFGLRKIHDLRACYACQRYQELTGCPAPVLNGGKVVTTPQKDEKARLIISSELGHKRPDIISAYIGGGYKRGQTNET